MFLARLIRQHIALTNFEMKKLTAFLGAFCFAFVFFARPALAASLSLSPASATKNVGDTFTVDIVLDTDGEAVSGATAIINYDTAKLAVVDGDSNASGVNIQPVTSSLSQVLTNTVNASTGQIRYDAGNLGSPFTGRGTIATITFNASSTGVASANFVFVQNATTNTSAVVEASGPTSLLDQINNGTYTINASGSSGGAGGDGDESLPVTGTFENTIMMIFGGLGFLVTGLLLARKALHV